MNSFSMSRDRTGVTEIGLKSWHVLGSATLGTGVIELDFHWTGKTEKESDKLKRLAIGKERNGAAVRRNQEGIQSRPVAYYVGTCYTHDSRTYAVAFKSSTQYFR